MIDLVLPALDEAAALPAVLGRVPAGVRAIVVDNGSTDATPAIAADLGAVVVAEPQRGYGAACHRGLISAEAAIVAFMDCDGSLDPAILPDMAQPVIDGEVDLMLGARDAAPGAWPVHARLANRFLAWELGRRSSVKITDIGPVRIARRVELIDLDVEDRRFGYPLETVLKAALAGWRIAERPVRYEPRTGRSKVTGTVRGTGRAIRDMSAVLR